jgi:hypothetical protein
VSWVWQMGGTGRKAGGQEEGEVGRVFPFSHSSPSAGSLKVD